MFIKQLYTGCLSEAAYYIENNGEAAVVDPVRDIEVYLNLAAQRKAQIKYIFETHFHADFVSGHLDLAKATDATIVYGPGTETNFNSYVAQDEEIFLLGGIKIQALHTPGHTMESTCYLMKNKDEKDFCVFTGDTLLVGEVGRPDLAQNTKELTMELLAARLYDSLHKKIIPLANDVIVYPAHGPGSACGKNLGPNTQSTIGAEKLSNYALRSESREAFIRSVTEGLVAPPLYFPINAKLNKEGYESLDHVLKQGLQPLSINDIKNALKQEVIVLDTRQAQEFSKGFIPGSIFIGLEGRFAEWAGSLLPFHQPMILITNPGQEKEAIVRLARVGFNKVKGYLEGGFNSWKAEGEAIDMIIDIEADELAMDIPFDPNLVVLDVRKATEFADGHVKDARLIPLEEMTDPLRIATLQEDQNIYIHCQGGYRSMIAASLLKRHGFHNIRNMLGGYDSIKEEKKIKTEKETSVLN